MAGSTRKWGPYFLLRTRRLWDRGLSAAAIAEASGLGREGRNIIIGIAHRNGFPPRPSPLRKFTPGERDAIVAKARVMVRNGLSTGVVGDRLGISQSFASRLVRDINPRRKVRAARSSSHIGAA